MKNKLFIGLLTVIICLTLVGCNNICSDLEGCKKSEDLNIPKIGDIIYEKVVEKLSNTKKIIVEINENDIKTTTDENEIQKVLEIIYNSREYEGDVTYEGTTRILKLYNSNDELLESIYVWDNYIGFSHNKEYILTSEEDIEYLREFIGIV